MSRYIGTEREKMENENTAAENLSAESAENTAGDDLTLIRKNQEDMKAEMEGLKSDLKKVRGSLRTSKIINVLTLLILLALIGAGVFAGYKGYQMYTEYVEPVVNQISELNLDETVGSLNLDDVGDAIEALQNIDIDSIADQLEGLDIDEIMDQLDGISQSLDNLKDDFGN